MRRAQRVTAIIVVCIHQGANYSCYDFIVQLTTEVARDVTKVDGWYSQPFAIAFVARRFVETSFFNKEFRHTTQVYPGLNSPADLGIVTDYILFFLLVTIYTSKLCWRTVFAVFAAVSCKTEQNTVLRQKLVCLSFGGKKRRLNSST